MTKLGNTMLRKPLIISALPPTYKILDRCSDGLRTICGLLHCFKFYKLLLLAKIVQIE